jgi:16S rRNA U1498 N3-methylase RsmE
MGDIKAIKEHCTEMGAQELYPLMAAILTKKPWDDIVSSRTERLGIFFSRNALFTRCSHYTG